MFHHIGVKRREFCEHSVLRAGELPTRRRVINFGIIPFVFRRLRAWWSTQSAPYRSPAYNAAMEALEPGYGARLASENADAEQRRRREDAWFESLVALQQAGRIEEAANQALADMNANKLGFVLDPLERVAMLYAREVDRLLALGDADGAAVAAREADRHMRVWASWSTSGGEGTARSGAADRMQQELHARLRAHNARTGDG